MANDIQAASNALKAVMPELHARENVVATGIGYKVTKGQRTSTLAIVCSVTRKLSASELSAAELVPGTLDGVPTDVVETGRLRAFQSHTARYRPAPGGVSIGHREITAGTLGCLVRKGTETFILSNNHVIANSNDARPGDAILQPGPIDGGRFPADHIADLEDFVPIRFLQPEPPSQCSTARAVIATLNWICAAISSQTRYRVVSLQAEDNLVDAAIAKPLNASDVTDEILRIGPIQGVADANLGDAIKKSGRTTELTTGQIQQVAVTADVSYGAGRTARFVDQLLAGPMSQGGDSGSAVLDDSDRLVGLLFAGSDNTTIINRVILSLVLLATLAAANCNEEAQMQPSIQDVKSRHEAQLMAAPGVVSVGIGLDDTGETVIVVGLDRERAQTRALLPQTIEGYAVRIEVMGTIKAQ